MYLRFTFTFASTLLQALTAAQSAAETASRVVPDERRVKELEAMVDAKHKELEEVNARAAAAERSADELTRDKDMLEKKVSMLLLCVYLDTGRNVHTVGII